MPKDKISINNLAQSLNLSASTISRALNNMPGVSQQKAEKIKKYADSLGYRPSPYHGGKSSCIALLFADDTSHDEQFQRRLIYIAERYADSLGKFLFVNFANKESQTMSRLLKSRRVDGILLASCPTRDLVKNIKLAKMPVVAIEDLTIRLNCDCIIANPASGSIELVEKLMTTGCRRFSFVIGDRKWPSIDHRFQAMEMSLRENGLYPPPEMVIENVDATILGGQRATRKLINTDTDVIIYGNDWTAIGGIVELNKHGIKIPDQISVAAFDNSNFCSEISPSLTSVDLNMETVVKTAVDKLLDLIDEKKESQNYSQIEISSSLVWRDSCRSIPQK